MHSDNMVVDGSELAGKSAGEAGPTATATDSRGSTRASHEGDAVEADLNTTSAKKHRMSALQQHKQAVAKLDLRKEFLS